MKLGVIEARFAILVIYLVRLVLRSMPAFISYNLWGVVLLRLLASFSIPSDFSLIPERVSRGEVAQDGRTPMSAKRGS